MTSVSLVLNCLPSQIETAALYVDALKRAFPNSVEILVATMPEEQTFGLEYSDFVIWANDVGITLIETVAKDWHALNTLVGWSKSEWVVVLEEDWWPVGDLESFLAGGVDGSDSDLVYFHRNDAAALGDLESPNFGWTKVSHPRAVGHLGYAYAIRRQLFLELRGYDERPGYVELAGLDFHTRVRWAGVIATWCHIDEGLVFHDASVCPDENSHRPASGSHLESMQARVNQDKSLYRNLVYWSVAPEHRVPLVTVAIATHNRGEMISDSIYSVLMQTFQEFEIIVVDDGSESDEAKRFVESLHDERIRYVYQENSGISAARNLAADLSKCRLTAVHDDDDIMLPNRLEIGIRAITAEYDASYGSWINFSDTTGELRGFFGRLEFSSDVNAFNGQGPGHATWTLPTRLIQLVRYDEHLTASVDHNLASRLEWIGVKWRHVEKYMYLRRVHDNQVTAQDSHGQKVGHRLTRYANTLLSSRGQKHDMELRGKAVKYPKIAESSALSENFAGFLPDHLVDRTATFSKNTSSAQNLADVPDRMRYLLEDRNMLTGTLQYEASMMSPVALADLARWRLNGLIGIVVNGEPKQSIAPEALNVSPDRDVDAVAPIDEGLAVEDIKTLTYGAAQSRLSEIIENHTRAHPDGSALVVSDAEPYIEFVDHELLKGAVLARRVVAAGEFGVSYAYQIFGYAHRLTGLRLAAVYGRQNANMTLAVYTSDTPASVMISNLNKY